VGRGTAPPLGQHFLHDRAVIKRIIDALEPEGWTVLEIGPGRGALTYLLAELAERLVAVELDGGLAAGLQTDPQLSEATVHHGDILERPLSEWVAPLPERGFLVVGNLPYQITSPVLFACLEARAILERAVLMMQREVAERLVANPGSKTYGVITVLTALYASPKLLFTLGRGAFKPPPRVESAVVRIGMRRTPLGGVDTPGGPSSTWVAAVVKAAFTQRRKMLRNSLVAGLSHLSTGELRERADEVGIDLRRRAETLSPEEFITLARVLPGPFDV